MTSTLYGMVAGTLMLLPFAVGERGWRALAAAPAIPWLGLLYLATFGSVFAFALYYEGIRRIGAGRASAFAFLVPVIGVVTSVLLLGEKLTAVTAFGGVLVLLGLWLVQRANHPEPQTAGAAQRS